MRKAVGGAVALVALVSVALVFAPAIRAQVRGGAFPPDIERLQPGLLLQGPGSEIGVSVRDLRGDELSATRTEGVFVQDVSGDSPASRAGLRTGDVVVEFDGERVRGVRQLTRLVRETPPGRTVKATIVRDGSRQTLDVTPEEGGQLSRLPDLGREIRRGMRAVPPAFDLRDFNRRFFGPWDLAPNAPGPLAGGRLGVSLAPLGDQLASYFGVKEGALVSAVEADSPAAQAGVRAGDVITAIAGRTVRDPGDVTSAIRDAAPGSAVEIRLVRDKKEITVKATFPDRGRTFERRIPV